LPRGGLQPARASPSSSSDASRPSLSGARIERRVLRVEQVVLGAVALGGRFVPYRFSRPLFSWVDAAACVRCAARRPSSSSDASRPSLSGARIERRVLRVEQVDSGAAVAPACPFALDGKSVLSLHTNSRLAFNVPARTDSAPAPRQKNVCAVDPVPD
jgi:hypothetical protein